MPSESRVYVLSLSPYCPLLLPRTQTCLWSPEGHICPGRVLRWCEPGPAGNGELPSALPLSPHAGHGPCCPGPTVLCCPGPTVLGSSCGIQAVCPLVPGKPRAHSPRVNSQDSVGCTQAPQQLQGHRTSVQPCCAMRALDLRQSLPRKKGRERGGREEREGEGRRERESKRE